MSIFSKEMGCGSSQDVGLGENTIPITVLGLPDTGKTSIIEFLADDYHPDDPPVSCNGIVQRTVIVHQKSYLFFDTCGYTSHSDEWIQCIDKSEAIILVFDPMVIDSAKIHVQALVEIIAEPLKSKKIPILIIINKSKDDTTTENIEELIHTNLPDANTHYSLIKKINEEVFSAFEWIESFVAK